MIRGSLCTRRFWEGRRRRGRNRVSKHTHSGPEPGDTSRDWTPNRGTSEWTTTTDSRRRGYSRSSGRPRLCPRTHPLLTHPTGLSGHQAGGGTPTRRDSRQAPGSGHTHHHRPRGGEAGSPQGQDRGEDRTCKVRRSTYSRHCRCARDGGVPPKPVEVGGPHRGPVSLGSRVGHLQKSKLEVLGESFLAHLRKSLPQMR